MSITDGTVLDQTELRRLYATIPTKYTVFKDGANYVAKTTLPGGADYTSTSAATVINDAIAALTGGRTWKEKIVLMGNITLDAKIVPQDYTVIEVQGKVTLANGVDDDMIENSDPSGGNSNIDVIVYGALDGNKSGQTIAGNGINFMKVTDSTVAVYGKIVNCFLWGLYMGSCDRNQIPIIRVTDSLGGVELENSDENQVGLVYAKDIDYTGFCLYDGCLKNMVDSVTGINCGANPDPTGGGETFRIDNGNSYNQVGKIYSYNSGYEGVRVEINSLHNHIGDIEIYTVSNTANIDGVEIYNNALGTIIDKIYVTGVPNGSGVLIDSSDAVQINSGFLDGTGSAAGTCGVLVYNSDDCMINVLASVWARSGVIISGNSARTIVRGTYTSCGAYGIEEIDTADYTLATGFFSGFHGSGAYDIDAANSVVGNDKIAI